MAILKGIYAPAEMGGPMDGTKRVHTVTGLQADARPLFLPLEGAEVLEIAQYFKCYQ